MNDLNELAADVGARLKAAKDTVAVAESSAGGLISASLLAVPGASAYYLGGTVVYTLKARHELLGIPDDVLKGLKPLTEEYVLTCARTIRDKMGATWGIAELGATGPTGTRYGHPAGIGCFAVAGPVELASTLETGSDDRVGNMWTFTRTALDLLGQALDDRG
jgi:PncC family amidohydrolase